MTPQTTETPPTGHDELAKGAEGEEPVTTRTTASGDIEAGEEFALHGDGNGRQWVKCR